MEYLVIGSGVAGISAVKELIKERSENDKITVVSDEKYPFYYRPRLIEYLSGEVEIDDIIINDKDWFEKNNVDLNLEERVIDILPKKNKVISQKNTYTYDKLLLANGAHCFIPPIEGADNENVFTLRKAEDAEEIFKAATNSEEAIVIGGGLLGLESAYNLSQAGLKVTVMERGNYLLNRQLDKEGAKTLQSLLEKKGLNFVLNASTEKIVKNQDDLEVLISEKGKYSTDLVLLSTGVRSNTSLVSDTNIKVNKGILVNKKMETNIEDIYAAGDVAECNGKVYGIWPPSMKQGKIAGKNLLDINDKFEGFVSSYSLKVAGVSLVSKGIIDDNNHETEVMNTKEKYRKIVKKNDKIIGAILIGKFDNKNEIINKVEEI
ncbi:MAG: NAD(P)/FAD-dependent oxidoreductase [Bacillota bacterium]